MRNMKFPMPKIVGNRHEKIFFNYKERNDNSGIESHMSQAFFLFDFE